MAFVPEAVLIALREGLEAFLITGILLGLVAKLGRPDARKHVWLGFGAAVAVSAVLGFVIQRFLLDAFEARGGGELFELVAALVAVVVLTYMVLWMWSHTRTLLASVRRKVSTALDDGKLFAIAFLAFVSVLREGVEVVLFYGALAARSSVFDVVWSGMVGFVLSALLVWAILAGARRLDLQKFFAVTGALLVFIAAGLLVHGVHAAAEIGLLPEGAPLWNTGDAIPDDRADGRILHALFGYTAAPTLLQALLYFGYVFGVGGWYLWNLGLFHVREGKARRVHPVRVGVAAALLVLALVAVGVGAAVPTAPVDHAHGEEDPAHGHEPLDLSSLDGPVGVLFRSHGEPPHYNETTYESFAHFVEGILRMYGYSQLLLVDDGTVLLDRAHPFATTPQPEPEYMDAWTHPHAGPAVWMGDPTELVLPEAPVYNGFYLAPGPGPGWGEPDILEIAGLVSYTQWLKMEGFSPFHEQSLLIKRHAEALLRERYGDKVVVQYSYHVRPFVGDGETEHEAGRAFRAAGASVVVDAYTSAIFSDAMNTCMMRPEALAHLRAGGFEGPVVSSTMIGPQPDYAQGVLAKVNGELASLRHDRVAVFLTHHGADPARKSPCAEAPDQYNANAKRMFESVHATLEDGLVYDGEVRVFQVYGQGADAADDGVLSPREALQAARAWGATHVLDLPYELSGNGFDNLVRHRESYGLEWPQAPYYDANHETFLTFQGLTVKIASSLFGIEARGAALAHVVEEALAGYLDGSLKPHPPAAAASEHPEAARLAERERLVDRRHVLVVERPA